MNALRKGISILLILVLAVSLTPRTALAAPRSSGEGGYWIPNPRYPDAQRPADFITLRQTVGPRSNSSEDHLSLDQAGDYFLAQMKNRIETISVKFYAEQDDPRLVAGDGFNTLLNQAFRHTGDPKGGDYQSLSFGGCQFRCSDHSSGSRVYYDMVFQMDYFTTAQQEQELDEAIDRVLKELALEGMSDYEKVCRIYEYIADHVSYDYANKYNPDYQLQYSAYAALIHGTSVCQGYATLLYRLLLASGVDCRCITGYSGEDHAWNIVRLGELYYNVDVTWDEILTPGSYHYFLKGDSFSGTHQRDPEFTTEEFHRDFPTSPTDFDPSQIHTHSIEKKFNPVTCTASSSVEYSCYCGYYEREWLEPYLGHDYCEWYIVTAATCTTRGVQARDCSRCGEHEDYFLTYGDHSWDEGVVTKAPTVDATGELLQTCSVCQETRTEVLPHIHTYVPEVREATCEEAGQTVFTCACGDSYTEEIPVLKHSYAPEIVAPTCSSAGWNMYVCSGCGHRYTESMLPQLPCSYERTVVEPTCSRPGYVRYHCPACNDEYTESYTQPLGHSWELEWSNRYWCLYICTRCEDETGNRLCDEHDCTETVIDPTCSQPGYTRYHCRICTEAWNGAYTDPTGHQYEARSHAPGCTISGYTEYVCTCGDSYEDGYVPALGHNPQVKVVEPTCTEGGYTESVCASCGSRDTSDPTQALGHDYEQTLLSGETCQEYSRLQFRCTRCDHCYEEETEERGSHDFDKGEVLIDATATEPGVLLRRCTLCSRCKTEEIPRTGIPFTDVAEGTYFYDPVIWAVERGITTGTSATTFSPNRNCTRGQVVTFLWRAAGMPEPTATENPFHDVKADQYYYKAVLWAVEQGITTGMGGGRFAPDSEVTRAQFVTFLWRRAGKELCSTQEMPFADVLAGDYFRDAVAWALHYGITTGTSATTFGSGAGCTRAQVVTFLYRYDHNPHASGNWFYPPEGVELNRHPLWQDKVPTEPGRLPAWDSEVSYENLKAVLEAFAPDSAFLLRWSREDYMQWLSESTRLTADVDIATHETYHGFSFSKDGVIYYLGDGYQVTVPMTTTFYSSEIDSMVPAENKTDRYLTYIGGLEHENMYSVVAGIYGLMDEFNAYGTGMRCNVDLFDYICTQGLREETLYDYVNNAENDRLAYAEFRYYILTYLLYARENAPGFYQIFMDNTALRYAFTVVERRYAENIEAYEKQLQLLSDDGIPGFEAVVVEENAVFLGSYRINRFTETYRRLMEYMERPEYQEIFDTFCVYEMN